MRTIASLLAAALITASPALAQHAQPVPSSLAKDAAPPTAGELAARTIAYLRAAQDKATGAWGVNPKGPSFPAITGLVVQGLLMDPSVKPDDPALVAGIEHILKSQQPDGGIYDKITPSYNTAICLTALSRVPNPSPRIKAAMAAAQKYLLGIQYGEGAVSTVAVEPAQVVAKDHAFYGGWGYGRSGRPDLSNSAFVIEALHASGLPENDAAFQRALVFLQRCQMQEKAPDGSAINDMPYAKGSTQGGFIYATSPNKDSVGQGSSMAGEIAESLSGDPGVVAHVRLKNGADGKPLVLTRDEIALRLRKRFELSSDMNIAGLSKSFLVVFGPGAGPAGGSEFDVRAGTTSVKPFEIVAGMAFHDVVDAAHPVVAEAVSAWKGESQLRSYGSMTYSGLKSYLYAGLSRNDPRVLAAKGWISRHYTLDENPGVGTDGLYYYYVVFSRALHEVGEPVVITPGDAASTHDWKRDLTAKLATLQNPDGSFRPVDDRWMENNPVLIAAYSLLALEHAR